MQRPHIVQAPTDPQLSDPQTGRSVHLLDTWAEDSGPWASTPHLPCLSPQEGAESIWNDPAYLKAPTPNPSPLTCRLQWCVP